MKRVRGSGSVESLVVLVLVALAGASSLRTLGSAMGRDVGGASDGAAPAPMAVSTLAGLGEVARLHAPEVVARMRAAAANALAAGKADAWANVSRATDVLVDAVPRYADTIDDIKVTGPEYAFQKEQLTRALDEAWDESFARGFVKAPTGRQMLEFTGMDKAQRAATRLIYSPDGVISVYMHGGPSSMSRHAFLLKPVEGNPSLSRQVRYEEIQLSTGKTKMNEYWGASISPEKVAARIAREGFPAGTPILLRACSAGGCAVKGLSIAQQLADATQRPVVAASDIHRRPVVEGELRVRVQGDTGAGSWRLFLPQSWHHDLPTGGELHPGRDLRGVHEMQLLPDGAFDRIVLDGPLGDFSGVQNRGAMRTAASKLRPGGTLVVEWSPSHVRRLVREAIAEYRNGYRENVNAEKKLRDRAAYVDPWKTLRELESDGYMLRRDKVRNGRLTVTVTAPTP